MGRIVKEADERRSELVACAQNLFYTKGFESTSVSDIVHQVGVAKGTFYYYFDSKQAILEAAVAEMTSHIIGLLHTIVTDASLAAIPKWVRAFKVVGNWKVAHKDELIGLLHTLYRDENLRLRHNLEAATLRRLTPEIAKIVAQGVEEGVFDVAYVEEAAAISITILQSFSDDLAAILLFPEEHDNQAETARRKLAAAEAAIERVLGAPEGSLSIVDEAMIAVWFKGVDG